MLKKFKNQLASLSDCTNSSEYNSCSNKLRLKLYLLATIFFVVALVGLVFTIILIKKAVDVYNEYEGLMLKEGDTFEYVGNILSPLLLFIPSALLIFVGIRILLMATKIPKNIAEAKQIIPKQSGTPHHHSKIKCRKCEHPNDSHNDYCEKCGTKLD